MKPSSSRNLQNQDQNQNHQQQILRRPIHACFAMDEETTAWLAIHKYFPEPDEERWQNKRTHSLRYASTSGEN
jgi:hypothetical protein